MAFVCTLSRSGLPVVATYPTLTSLVYPIGYDDADGRVYQLFIGFDTAPGGIIEYSFCIVCQHKDGVTHDFWDSQVISSMISKEDRALILEVLLAATRSLVQASKFPEVVMRTFIRDLPPKALVKYRYIEQIFMMESYAIIRDEHRGQHTWRFERRQPTGE